MNKQKIMNFMLFSTIFVFGIVAILSSEDFSSKYSSVGLVWFFIVYMASIKETMEIGDLDLCLLSGAWLILSFLFLSF